MLAVTLLLADWSLHYERSNFLETGRYDEALAYCRRLASASPYARVHVYGKSPEGRDMFALLVSRDREFAPERMRGSKKPLIFVQNGIHSGEIEGKDASLILARDMLVTNKRKDLLDGANFVIVPIYSVDSHERFGPFNRINQNGPAQMGWRATSQNFNLNRDYIKADAPESKAQVRLLHQYRPDFFFDNHTTNGADYQYSLMLSVPSGPTLPRPLATWQTRLYDAVKVACDRDGFLTGPYFGLVDRADPSKGVTVDDFSPRYSHGYLSALNIPSMLVETHMLKPYRHRVDSTYSVMVNTVRYVIQHRDELKGILLESVAQERAGRPLPVLGSRRTETTRLFTFKAWAYTPYRSGVTGTDIARWDRSRPLDVPTRIADAYEPALTVEPPAAYAVPVQWTEVIDRLRLHGFQVQALQRPMSAEFRTYAFSEVTFARTPFEGRFQPQFRVVPIIEPRTLPKGSVVVRVNQANSKLLMSLLEPEAPDSLARWGFFNNVFETKEYFEDYAMDPVASEMLRRDPKLRAEFEARLKDEAFARNPRARLQFFHERSGYMDRALNKYPIVRLTAEQLAAVRL